MLDYTEAGQIYNSVVDIAKITDMFDEKHKFHNLRNLTKSNEILDVVKFIS